MDARHTRKYLNISSMLKKHHGVKQKIIEVETPDTIRLGKSRRQLTRLAVSLIFPGDIM